MFITCLSRSTFTVCLIVMFFGAGEPFGEKTILPPVNNPTAFAVLPVEVSVPSKFASPLMPVAGSTNPEAPMFILLTLTAVSKGVFDTSSVLIGPAFPVMLTSPLLGNEAVSLKGNCEVFEKLETSIFTLSYTVGLAVELALPTINFPFAMFSSATEMFWAAWPDDFGAVAACLFAPPRLEKFHVPVGVFSSVICGSWRVMPVMYSCLEKISGIISTPTFSDFAVINGDLLNLGSSAIAMFSASTLPDSSERLRLPTVTWRPSASVSSDSIFGRKLFT